MTFRWRLVRGIVHSSQAVSCPSKLSVLEKSAAFACPFWPFDFLAVDPRCSHSTVLQLWSAYGSQPARVSAKLDGSRVVRGFTALFDGLFVFCCQEHAVCSVLEGRGAMLQYVKSVQSSRLHVVLVFYFFPGVYGALPESSLVNSYGREWLICLTGLHHRWHLKKSGFGPTQFLFS